MDISDFFVAVQVFGCISNRFAAGFKKNIKWKNYLYLILFIFPLRCRHKLIVLNPILFLIVAMTLIIEDIGFVMVIQPLKLK